MEPVDDTRLFLTNCRIQLTLFADEMSRLDGISKRSEAARKRAYNALRNTRQLINDLIVRIEEGD